MIDIKIMAHPKRSENVERIINKLRLPKDNVIWDDRPNGGDAMYTARKAWLAPIHSNYTHRLVLQDDVGVCDDFISHATAIANRHKTHVVSLINFDNLSNYPNHRETPYYRIKGNMSGCAIMIPVNMIRPCMDWIDKSSDETLKLHDDLMISKYCRDHNILMVATVPCIVQHLGGDSSLLGAIYNWDRKSKNYSKNPEANWSAHSVLDVK